MKCLDSERLIGYAYRLLDESAAAQVRAHLGECPRCRATVEQYRRLDSVLDEWSVAGPSPGFDACARQAVEPEQVRRGFWVREWARSLAFAPLGVLIIATVVLLTPGQRRVPVSSGVGTQQPHPAAGAPTSAQIFVTPQPVGARAGLKPGATSAVVTGTGQKPGVPSNKIEATTASSLEDYDAQALEDYDLAANFDLLSELPKGQKRIAN